MRARSSGGQSNSFLNCGPQVRVLPGALREVDTPQRVSEAAFFVSGEIRLVEFHRVTIESPRRHAPKSRRPAAGTSCGPSHAVPRGALPRDVGRQPAGNSDWPLLALGHWSRRTLGTRRSWALHGFPDARLAANDHVRYTPAIRRRARARSQRPRPAARSSSATSCSSSRPRFFAIGRKRRGQSGGAGR